MLLWLAVRLLAAAAFGDGNLNYTVMFNWYSHQTVNIVKRCSTSIHQAWVCILNTAGSFFDLVDRLKRHVVSWSFLISHWLLAELIWELEVNFVKNLRPEIILNRNIFDHYSGAWMWMLIFMLKNLGIVYFKAEDEIFWTSSKDF